MAELFATLSPQDWQAIRLTLKLCLYTTVILLLLGTPLAWWMARTRSWLKGPVGAMVALPIVKADGFHAGVTREGVGQAGGGVLPAREQHEGAGVVGVRGGSGSHGRDRSAASWCAAGLVPTSCVRSVGWRGRGWWRACG